MSDTPEPVEPANDDPSDDSPTDPSHPPTWDEVRKLRREAARYRTANKALTATDEHVKGLSTENRQLKVDLELERTFGRRGAKGNLVRAVLIDRGLMGKFDPMAEDFSESIDGLVGEILVESPELRASNVPSRSGPDLGAGGNRESVQFGLADVQSMSSSDVVEALKSGRLNRLLGR